MSLGMSRDTMTDPLSRPDDVTEVIICIFKTQFNGRWSNLEPCLLKAVERRGGYPLTLNRGGMSRLKLDHLFVCAYLNFPA